MAAFDTTRPTYDSAPVVAPFFARLMASVISWNAARATRSALDSLTDRELEDIGLVRGDIELVAAGKMRR
ncbi:DUF1127 domain-containing protein [uncultured Roseobacter sp.]|uniref:DUF1127 domain-containing protein n=1 Tax=uncultured Roseobacter sp. TaxID=114847 RepID=UPI002635B0A1|nr:DUF1127 domain-containing protein [uncultured Roseobacter sp.]